MWKTTKYASILAALILGITMIVSESAAQEAAGAAIAIGLAIIPYCIARANDEISKDVAINKDNGNADHINHESDNP